MSLCDDCSQLFQVTLPLGGDQRCHYGHHSTPQSFFDAVKSQCYICSKVFRDMSTENQAIIEEMAATTRHLAQYIQSHDREIDFSTHQSFLTAARFYDQAEGNIKAVIEVNVFYEPKITSSHDQDILIHGTALPSGKSLIGLHDLGSYELVLLPSSSPCKSLNNSIVSSH